MTNPEVDYGFAYDDQGNVNILHSLFFDYNPEVDNSIEEYEDRILFTLSEANDQQLAGTQWQVVRSHEEPCFAFCLSLVNKAVDAIAVIGHGYKLPSYHNMRVNLLRDCKEKCRLLVDSYRQIWKVTDITKDATTLCSLFAEVVEWVGPESVVQIVTDNAANYKKAGILQGLVELIGNKDICSKPTIAMNEVRLFRDGLESFGKPIALTMAKEMQLSDGEIDGDIISGIQVGWLKWRNAPSLLCDRKVPLKLKGKFYKMVVRPAMLYDAECWPLKEKHNTKLSVAEMRMLRWMSGFTLRDRIQNEHIREKYYEGCDIPWNSNKKEPDDEPCKKRSRTSNIRKLTLPKRNRDNTVKSWQQLPRGKARISLSSRKTFTHCQVSTRRRTSTGYRTLVGHLSENGFLFIVGLLPDAVLLTFIVRHNPFNLCRQPTTVLLTYVAHRLQSFRPPSPTYYSPSDLRRQLTTVLLTSVAHRLQSFQQSECVNSDSLYSQHIGSHGDSNSGLDGADNQRLLAAEPAGETPSLAAANSHLGTSRTEDRSDDARDGDVGDDEDHRSVHRCLSTALHSSLSLSRHADLVESDR
ncbi:hypothetical protein KFK09_028783 [Dendrobium nobile]|uniref:DUF659 domain-containing protein n=1 Tax=Dendrobium nobile TaxID=94219 RepID=A0A8T3A2W3_DENNO|nr:hypothetical protein KFK09_028783 [Dendrobium nobile]